MRRSCSWASLVVVVASVASAPSALAQGWTQQSGGLPATPTVRAVAVDPSNPDRVYVGVQGRGVYRTANARAATVAWAAPAGFPGGGGGADDRTVLSIAVNPVTPATVYAGTQDGLYRSQNAGASWAQLALDNVDVFSLAVDPTNPQVVYAGTESGLRRSTNGGASFASAVTVIGARDVLALAIDPAAPSTVYAGTTAGLWKTTDGTTWTLQGDGLPANAVVQALALDRGAPGTAYAGTTAGLWKTTTGGGSWALTGLGAATNVQALALDGPALYAGTTTAVTISTTAGATWTPSLAAQDVRALVVDPLFALAGVSGSGVHRQVRVTATKTTAQGGDWGAAATWTPAGAPGAGDTCLVLHTVTVDASSPTVTRVLVRAPGSLTIGAARTLTVTAATDVLSGDLAVTGAGAALVATGPVTVAAPGRLDLASTGAVRLRPGLAPLRVEGTLRGRGSSAVLERDGASGAVDVQVMPGGVLDVGGDAAGQGLTLRHGDLEGLHVRAGATIARLRDARFEASAAVGGRYLTLESTALQLSAPGCRFGPTSGSPTGTQNVLLVDPAAGATDDLAVTFEDRGPAVSGVDAGEARSVEQGGAAANWVWACPDTTRGAVCGAPQVAWDQVSGADYAMYVAFTDVDAAGTDRVHVFDPTGNGVERSYWFDVPDAHGDLAGFPWWDTAPDGAHVLWATTTGGYAYVWTDPGAGAGALAPQPGWPVRFVDTFTTPPVGDRTNIYAGGTIGGTPFIGGIDRSTLSFVWAAYFASPVRTLLATEVRDGLNYVYGGTNVAGDGRARLYRVNVAAQAVDLADTTATSAVTAYPFVILGAGLFVGDQGGWLHGLDQATMLRRPNFPVRLSTSPIQAGVFLDFVTDDHVYAGTQAGQVFRVTPTATTVGGWPVQPLGPAPIRSAPLVDAGVLWVSNAEGRVGAVDASTRTLIEQWRFGAGAAPSELSQEFSAGRVVLTTSRGRLYVVAARTDPTP